MGCGLLDNSLFLRVARSAHSPSDAVGTFSLVKVQTKQSKWVLFRLTKTTTIGCFFDEPAIMWLKSLVRAIHQPDRNG
jgi:hypothetical protein